ncbi:hypothetical protein [Pararhodobacter sp.]|uniref:hypothetical protein n=1 Tax=Pararhodobacter sp. TaxID=2127056 RepID=UPI002FDDD948
MAVDLGMEVGTLVTPSLHPQTVASLEDYDDDTKGELAQVVTAFDTAYKGIAQVFEAREKAKQNLAWSEATQTIMAQDFADKVFAKVAGGFDKVHRNLTSGIAALEKELTGPMDTAAAGRFGREIRDHVKALPDGKRTPFVIDAIERGDFDAAAAVLSAPAYLSGLTEAMQANLVRQWHTKQNPVKEKRLRAMQAALDLVHQRGGLVFKELERAVGAPPHKVKALRDANTAAEKAFVMRGS